MSLSGGSLPPCVRCSGAVMRTPPAFTQSFHKKATKNLQSLCCIQICNFMCRQLGDQLKKKDARARKQLYILLVNDAEEKFVACFRRGKLLFYRKLCSLCYELCSKHPLAEHTRRVTSLIVCCALKECRSCFLVGRHANIPTSDLPHHTRGRADEVAVEREGQVAEGNHATNRVANQVDVKMIDLRDAELA